MSLFGNVRKYREFEPIRSNADLDIRFKIKIRDEEIVRLKEEIKKLKKEIKRCTTMLWTFLL